MENHLGEGVSSAFTLRSTSAYLRHGAGCGMHWEGTRCWEMMADSCPEIDPGASQLSWCPWTCSSHTQKHSGAPPLRWGGGSGCTAAGRGGCLGISISLRVTEARGNPRAGPGEPFSNHQKPGKAVTWHISLTWLLRDVVKPAQSVVTVKICSLPCRSCRVSSLHRRNSLCIQSKMKGDQIQQNFTKALTSQTNTVSLF